MICWRGVVLACQKCKGKRKLLGPFITVVRWTRHFRKILTADERWVSKKWEAEVSNGKLQRIQARKIRANVEIEDHNIADLLSWYGSKYPLRIRSLRTKSQEFCVHILETLVPLRSHRNGHSFSSINFISFNPPPPVPQDECLDVIPWNRLRPLPP